MKSTALAVGLLVALTVNAAQSPRAKLVGQRVISASSGSPILVCQYRTAEAKYEVVASSSRCAPYLALSET